MNKNKVSAVLACIAVIVLVISLSMPWWTFNGENTIDGETEENTNHIFPNLLPESSHYEDNLGNFSSTQNITTIILTVGTISAAVSVLLLGMTANTGRKNYKKIGAVLIVIGLISAVVAPVFFMVEMPNSYKKDMFERNDRDLPDHDSPAKSFFGSYSEDDSENSWRGGIGWFLSLISAVILAVALIMLMMSDRKNPYYQDITPRQQYRKQEPQPYKETVRSSDSEQQYQQEEHNDYPQEEKSDEEFSEQRSKYSQSPRSKSLYKTQRDQPSLDEQESEQRECEARKKRREETMIEEPQKDEDNKEKGWD